MSKMTFWGKKLLCHLVPQQWIEQLAYNVTFNVNLTIKLYLAVGLSLLGQALQRNLDNCKITITEKSNVLVTGLNITSVF